MKFVKSQNNIAAETLVLLDFNSKSGFFHEQTVALLRLFVF